MRIYQGGVDRVTFSGGKVGIGTTGPSQKLTLSANQTGANQGIPATSGTTQNGLLRLEAGGAYGESLDMGINVSTSFGWIQPTNKSNLAVNYNLVLNPNGGNVGIGTTNPLSNFVVSSSGAQGIELAPNVSTFGLSNINYATSYNRSGAAYTDLVFDMGGAATTAFVLKSGGNVGIGMVTPTAKLHIDQASTTAAIPVLTLDQADLSEEFIRFVSTVGAGNPIDTAAIGTYYGKVRVYVEGVGAKFIALYNS